MGSRKVVMLATAFLAATVSSILAPHLAMAAVPPGLQKIETKYAGAKSLEAEFSQSTFSKLTGSKKTASGVISLKIPDKFRWETLNPTRDKNLLVSDGRKFWSYTPPFIAGEKGQVVEKRTSEVQSQLASLLLSGSFSKIKDAKFEALPNGIYRFVPKKGSAGTIEKIDLTVDAKKSVIEKVKLMHDNGNESEIALSNLKFGEKFEDSFFRFNIPSGTEVIRE